MRHSSPEYCEAAEARIRALEEELEACNRWIEEAVADGMAAEENRVAAKAELARLRPVVEAAVAWLDSDDDDATVTLVDVLIAYRKACTTEAGGGA